MSIRYGVIEKTGKKEFLEELIKQIPKKQEIKLTRLEFKKQ